MIAARAPAERTRAMFRSLRVLDALQARPGGDAHAPDIAALGLPTEAAIDTFNGERLRIKKVSAGWTVYSVGADGVDDGGKLDVGFGPIGRESAPKQPPCLKQSCEPGVH